MSLITPVTLREGDQVAIVSTARAIDYKEIMPSVDFLESLGLIPVFGKTIGQRHDQFSGTIKQRMDDFQEHLDNPEIKAIWCARGGYGTVQIIDYIDFSNFRIFPKWIVGYSDITVLHTHINRLGYVTLSATMPINLKENTCEAINSLKKALCSDDVLRYCLPQNVPLSYSVKGTLLGGNLSVLCSLIGSLSEIDVQDSILIIEDIGEYLYHVDRMIMMLKRAGYFKKIKGLLVGGMIDLNDNAIPFGKNAHDIVKQHTEGLNIPVIFNVPFGHIANNCAFKIGGEMIIEADNSNSLITLTNV